MKDITQGLTDEIKIEIKDAIDKAIDERRLLNKHMTITQQVQSMNNRTYLGVFKRFEPQDHNNYVEAVELQVNENLKPSEKKLKGKTFFQVCLDCTLNTVLYPSREDFRKWAEQNSLSVQTIAQNIFLQSKEKGNIEEVELDFL